MYVQYVCAVCTYVQYVCAVCMCRRYVQYVHAVCMCSTYMQYVHTSDSKYCAFWLALNGTYHPSSGPARMHDCPSHDYYTL